MNDSCPAMNLFTRDLPINALGKNSAARTGANFYWCSCSSQTDATGQNTTGKIGGGFCSCSRSSATNAHFCLIKKQMENMNRNICGVDQLTPKLKQENDGSGKSSASPLAKSAEKMSDDVPEDDSSYCKYIWDLEIREPQEVPL